MNYSYSKNIDDVMTTKQQLQNLLAAHTPIIQIISYEVHRIHADLVWLAEEFERPLYVWNIVDGIRRWNSQASNFEAEDDGTRIEDAIQFFDELEGDAIFLMEDIHHQLASENMKLIKTLRNWAINMPKGRALILSQPIPQLPLELEKEVHVLTLDYPTISDLKSIYDKVCRKYGYFQIGTKNPPEPETELIEAALGLTIMEAEKAFSLAYVKTNQLTSAEIPEIIKEKEQVIKKSGFLEYHHPSERFSDVGGLGNLKRWLEKRRRGFDSDAGQFGLSYPRGILLLGIPGTGKSLTAKAVGSQWKFPLLKLDMGKIFGSYVGDSERNIRNALQIAESISPCVLWIDEIEKGLAGSTSSGSSDGGTTARVLGTFLTWMQEKQKPVFVLATANDISQLPPELLRKGRVDEIFFVDLPSLSEREEIIGIHLNKIGRNAKKFDCRQLAELSRGFSGAELAEALQEALYQAYDAGREVTTEHIAEAIMHTYPLSRTMSGTIANMRKWCQAKAVMASDTEPEELPEIEKSTPRLKQETYNNPFINN